jgi:hypothetical protein
MDAGPARRPSAGFSLAELLLTLALLALAVWVVLRIVDRGTRIRDAAPPMTGPDVVLDAAFRMVRKDVHAAGTGGLTARDAFRPVADNTPAAGRAAYRSVRGGTVAVRPGTDQLGLRGVIRSPLVPLEPRVPGTDEPVSTRMRARPDAVPVRAPAGAGTAAARAHLAEVSASGKAFFLVGDAAGRWAVARVASSAPGPGEGPLDLVLDFTDPDARALNGDGGPDACARLGDAASGGVFDDLVWFVAEGPEGVPPDYVRGSDPDSLRHPHPYLAAGVAAGNDLWEIREAGEDVEDLQVAWGFAGATPGLEWRGDAPKSAAPGPDDLADLPGRPRLEALRIALVARSPLRLPRSSGSPAPEFTVPLNGPAPGSLSGGAPIGWDAVPRRRIRFDREVREELVRPPALAGARRGRVARGV